MYYYELLPDGVHIIIPTYTSIYWYLFIIPFKKRYETDLLNRLFDIHRQRE